MNNKTFSRIKLITIFLSILVGSTATYYFTTPPFSIVEFDYNRDKQFIADQFDADWYWLTAQSRTETDPVKQFQLHAVSLRYPQTYGKLIIKMMYVKSQPVGFVAYYNKSFYEGVILFVDVNKEFRGKHYAEKLLRYAINDLFDHGVSIVRLITRPTNTSARALYERVGFKQYDIDDTFVHYEKLSR